MNVNVIIFDATTGAPLRSVQCDETMADMQAGAGERGLVTPHFAVEGNRDVIWQMVKAKRAERYAAGVVTPVGLVQTNPESREMILGLFADAVAAVLASDTTYERSFTATNDEPLVLTAPQMILVGRAIINYLDATHQYSQLLRGQINSAPTMAELLSIDINSGWPTGE